ncbi:class I SAM-dependent methyltransferase [Amycolatopsis rhabdoformis]|uniref:Class I SAM-dependent methyltransferase n=1 Tax=Amycolatopsis rhabdoformis TaxID=1448059 RepID=A0ABZ1HZC6_9PSEU|nr:class I SAM-dependent methyltransferase [Amycolatopsis rhabdoformis]WSE27478.1 class I SAM-dependent methyltransferase [Amycolatopsis rhabdoformis]
MIGSFPQYEVFADEFLDHAREGFYNAFVDRPACLSLLGDVAGRDVLDAACGPGLYAAELTARGARVTGFDLSPRMVALSRERVPAATFRVHDLGAPLGWLPSASVDLVLLALVYEYVDDRVAMLRELRRVLRPGGVLVLSRMHPTGDWLRHPGDYFTPRVVEETWNEGWHVRFWLSSLQDTCAELREAGFLIEQLVEPRPVPEGAAVDPLRYERLSHQPTGFLAIRAIPDPRRG